MSIAEVPPVLTIEKAAQQAFDRQRTFLGRVEGGYAVYSWLGFVIVNMSKNPAPHRK